MVHPAFTPSFVLAGVYMKLEFFFFSPFLHNIHVMIICDKMRAKFGVRETEKNKKMMEKNETNS